MKTAKLIIVAVLILGITACAKRQSNLRLVYVPAPAPAVSKGTGQGGVIVIQKPPPATPAVVEIKPERAPEPPQKPPPEPVQQVAKKVTREPPVASRPQPSADAPPLVPASSSQQQGTIQRHVRTLQHNIEVRIGRLARLSLGGADRKTLDDARTFVAESESAIERGDLAQASNLAQKADLLVLAVEKRR